LTNILQRCIIVYAPTIGSCHEKEKIQDKRS